MGVAVGSASCGDAANAGSAPFTASTIDKQRAEVALLTLRGMGFSCFGEDETPLPERQKRPWSGGRLVWLPGDTEMTRKSRIDIGCVTGGDQARVNGA
jgi:hypothetical protein